MNPLEAVLETDLKDATLERAALRRALQASGVASGEWLPGALAHLDGIRKMIADERSGSVNELGCFDAGCGDEITFRSRESVGDIYRLFQGPDGHGRTGVVVTKPAPQPDGSLVCDVFVMHESSGT